jgi:RNA polymerase sigma-70 factor (ECF subfamily)
LHDADRDILRRVQARCPAAFDELLERHRNALRLHANRLLRDADLAEDAVQESMLRVWERAEQWDGAGSVRGWLFRIVTNCSLNLLRARGRRLEVRRAPPSRALDHVRVDLEGVPDHTQSDPFDIVCENSRGLLVRSLVGALPPRKLEVIRLIYEMGMDIGEAAVSLGVPPGTVKSRLHHARKRLARELEKEEP